MKKSLEDKKAVIEKFEKEYPTKKSDIDNQIVTLNNEKATAVEYETKVNDIK